jgi:predicted HTH domain antitoxin
LPGEELIMKHLLLFLLFSAELFVSAQDVTGIWRGSFYGEQTRYMKLKGEEDRYKFEVQINQNAKAFEGVTYSYKTTIFYGKATCRGTVNPVTKKVLLEELKLVELKMLQGNSACVMTCYLQYSRNENEEFLEGTYSSYNNVDSSNCGGGTIFLRKVITSDFYKEPFLVEKEKKAKEVVPKTNNAIAKAPVKPPVKKPVTPPVKKPAGTAATTPTVKKPVTPTQKPVITQKPAIASSRPPATKKKTDSLASSATVKKTDDKLAENKKQIPKPVQATVDGPEADKKPLKVPKVLSTRENELVKTIIVRAGEISINIYDNGSVDNDTISVYLDKKLVLSKKRLTERAIKLNFTLDEMNDEHELVMVAENLGEIPPNTSLMVVTAGDKKYEVRITSTEQKNAVINFKLEKN